MKKGLEILGISIVDADVKDAVFLKAEQTFNITASNCYPSAISLWLTPTSQRRASSQEWSPWASISSAVSAMRSSSQA